MSRTCTRTMSESSHLRAGATGEVMRTNTRCVQRKTTRASLGTLGGKGVPHRKERCTESERLTYHCRTTSASSLRIQKDVLPYALC